MHTYHVANIFPPSTDEEDAGGEDGAGGSGVGPRGRAPDRGGGEHPYCQSL